MRVQDVNWSRRPEAVTACAVYRLFDAAGCLLYVGMGFEPRWRVERHLNALWGQRVESISVCWYLSEGDARAAEKVAIRDESPVFNRIRYRMAA